MVHSSNMKGRLGLMLGLSMLMQDTSYISDSSAHTGSGNPFESNPYYKGKKRLTKSKAVLSRRKKNKAARKARKK